MLSLTEASRAPSRPHADLPILTPTQQTCFDQVCSALEGASIVMVEGHPGMGKSTILRALQTRFGGAVIDIGDIQTRLADRSAQAFEQTVFEVISEAIAAHDTVYIEDVIHYQRANSTSFYVRHGLFNIVFKAIYEFGELDGKRIVVSSDKTPQPPSANDNVTYRPLRVSLSDLKAVDYQRIFETNLGPDRVRNIDFNKVYHFSRKLSGYFLKNVCDFLALDDKAAYSTEDVTAVLADNILRSNIDTREVENIDLGALVGVDDLIEKLDRTILLPMREPELAAELGLESKHGVLLYGEPGTGKTTIGRALAHMMKGKFFMIDGDWNHETGGCFFKAVDRIFDMAARNSPSVIFIDDADVILSDPKMQHFARYLLTKLDGIQSEAVGKVCVMMTAMDIGDMPLALLRSGRLEVWLETRLPDQAAREQMIRSYAERLPVEHAAVDFADLAGKTERFTPADVRRLVGDAAGHLAFDRHSDAHVRSFGDYLELSAAGLKAQKALAEKSGQRRGGRRYH